MMQKKKTFVEKREGKTKTGRRNRATHEGVRKGRPVYRTEAL